MSERKAFPLRISAALYAELHKWADAEFRSVNGQIEFLLQKAVKERTRRNDAQPQPESYPESLPESPPDPPTDPPSPAPGPRK